MSNGSTKRVIESILADVEYDTNIKKINEAEKESQIAHRFRTAAIELLKEYEGKKFSEIPFEALEKYKQYMDCAQKADKQYEKLIREVDKR